VVCFGIGAIGETFDRREFPYRIWTVGPQSNQLYARLAEFLSFEKPALVFFNMDVLALRAWVRVTRAIGWRGMLAAYVIVDGVPLPAFAKALLAELDLALTATRLAAQLLSSAAGCDVHYAPHGVDCTLFRPLASRGALRAIHGLADKFVVGVFGTNSYRKQLPRVVEAVALLRHQERADVVLYCHAQRRVTRGGWQLDQVVESFGMEGGTMFPGTDFTQHRGVPLQRADDAYAEYDDSLGQREYFPGSLSLVERINCCDCVVNVSLNGAFELGIIEAQACGVPLLLTNDEGYMAEASGGAALLLDVVNVGIGTDGFREHHVLPSTVAGAIQRVRSDSVYRDQLSTAGVANARQYSWEVLEDVVRHEVGRLSPAVH